MSEGLRVTIAGLSFYGEGLHEFQVEPGGFEGWDDGVEMRVEQAARPQAHGSFDLPGFQDSRTVSISGHAFADSPGHLTQLGRRLTGLLAGGQSGRIQVEQDGETLWADGRLAAQTMFTRKGRDWASFQVQIWCPDARKFGETTVLTAAQGAVLPIWHRGNFDAHPVVTVTGDLPGGYDLIGPGGAVFEVTSTVVAGAPHTVDFHDGILRINGVLSPSGTQRAEVWSVPPGADSTIQLVPNSGSNGTIAVSMTDTFI